MPNMVTWPSGYSERRYMLTEESKHSYINRLTKDLKIKKLGSGTFGTVFQHPTHPDVVVKVYYIDRMYEKFLRFVKKNQGNVYLPRIIDFVKIPDKDAPGGWHHIVFMEKLESPSRSVLRKFMKHFYSVIDLDGQHRNASDITYITPGEWQDAAEQDEDPDLQAVAKFAVYYQNYFDLHGANVMARGNQLVIIDPIADDRDIYKMET